MRVSALRSIDTEPHRPRRTRSLIIRSSDPSPSAVGSLFARARERMNESHRRARNHARAPRRASRSKHAFGPFSPRVVVTANATKRNQNERTRTHLPQRRVLRLGIDARARLDARASSRRLRRDPRNRSRSAFEPARGDGRHRAGRRRRHRRHHRRRSIDRSLGRSVARAAFFGVAARERRDRRRDMAMLWVLVEIEYCVCIHT